MTNDQKLVQLIHNVDELLKALDKADETKSHIYVDKARQQRRQMKVWIASNKIVGVTAPAVRKKPNRTLYNYLAR